MAGRPVFKAQLEHINSLGPDGEEEILARLAGGDSVKDVAEWLGFPRTSLTALYKWRDETEERKAAWAQALAWRSISLAEESKELADTVEPDNDAIRKAELQIKVRQWLAGVSNPDYAKERTPQVLLNVANMHLTAVESVNRELQAKAVARLKNPNASVNAQVQGADYEIVEDDEPEDPYAEDISEAEEDDLRDLL